MRIKKDKYEFCVGVRSGALFLSLSSCSNNLLLRLKTTCRFRVLYLILFNAIPVNKIVTITTVPYMDDTHDEEGV